MERSRLLGLLLGFLAALIGAAWQVLTRQATTTTLAPADLALLRYSVPALLLAPLWWRLGPWPRSAAKGPLLAMLIGAGLPFGLVAMAGTQFAPAAHMGVLMAGASPLLAALLAWACWRERPGWQRGAGLALMALAVAVLASQTISTFEMSEAWRGDLLFLTAAALWAGYTLAFRHSGLTPWQAAALISFWSALFVLPWWAWQGGRALGQIGAQALLFHALFQGVVAGVLGLWTISAAIARLGAAQAAAFGALVPALSAVGGWWWLGDPLGLRECLAVACAVLGVLLASGTWGRLSASRSGTPRRWRAGSASAAPPGPRAGRSCR